MGGCYMGIYSLKIHHFVLQFCVFFSNGQEIILGFLDGNGLYVESKEDIAEIRNNNDCLY